MVKRTRKNNRRRAQVGKPRTVVTRLPSPYNRLSADATVLKCRGVLTLKSFSSSYAGGILGLWPRGGTTPSLATLVTNCSSMADLYDLFIVTSMTIKMIPTVPTTVGSILAVGYEPTTSEENRDPLDLADVLISKHHASTNQVSEATFSFQPRLYRNDWCRTKAMSIDNTDNGYVQWYSSYTGGATGTTVGYLDISFDIAFAGLRRTNNVT